MVPKRVVWKDQREIVDAFAILPLWTGPAHQEHIGANVWRPSPSIHEKTISPLGTFCFLSRGRRVGHFQMPPDVTCMPGTKFPVQCLVVGGCAYGGNGCSIEKIDSGAMLSKCPHIPVIAMIVHSKLAPPKTLRDGVHQLTDTNIAETVGAHPGNILSSEAGVAGVLLHCIPNACGVSFL